METPSLEQFTDKLCNMANVEEISFDNEMVLVIHWHPVNMVTASTSVLESFDDIARFKSKMDSYNGSIEIMDVSNISLREE